MNEEKYINLINTTVSLDLVATEDIAGLLEYLINHELRPGGPYSLGPTAKENARLNGKVYELMLNSGKSLPNVLEYVQSMGYSPPKVMSGKNLGSASSAGYRASSIYDEIQAELSAISPEISAVARKIATKLQKVDTKGEITLISNLLARSIKPDFSNPPEKLIQELNSYGKANFYTWLAYSLYDAVLDEPNPSTVLSLPTANIFNRLAYQTYQATGAPSDTLRWFFDDVDTANTEEINYCRCVVKSGSSRSIQIDQLPSLALLKRLLSQRSIAHCLGPYLACKSKFQSLNRSFQPKTIRKIFGMYCAARQLNDDIHDWEDDLSNGRITYVSSLLLRQAHIKPGEHLLQELMPKLRKIFWDSELENMLITAHNMAQSAKQEFVTKLGVAPDSPFLDVTVVPIIIATSKALHDLKRTKHVIANLI